MSINTSGRKQRIFTPPSDNCMAQEGKIVECMVKNPVTCPEVHRDPVKNPKKRKN